MYFRCAPDWHSNHRDNSYIWFILVLGFLIPTVIIILSSLLTCANIREVSFYFRIIQSFYIVRITCIKLNSNLLGKLKEFKS